MGILGIRNRTENWKTAHSFAPFFTNKAARAALADRLLEPLEENPEVEVGTVKIELFWYGIRDYREQQRGRETELTPQNLAERYCRLFSNPDKLDLHRQIDEIDKHDTITTRNYNVSIADWKDRLWTNLNNTEIDIIVKTSKHLFIGEAKHETTGFDSDKERFLMHQLIREYVTARILVDCHKPDMEVVPFVVVDAPEQLREPLKHIDQIGFLRDQGWLKKENVLSWKCIEKLASSGANNG